MLGCSANRSALPTTYKGRQIVVGNGGGFTGLTTTYYLLDNGKLLSRSSRDTVFTQLGKPKSTLRKQLFRAVLDTCQIRTTAYNEPGNVSRFVQFQNAGETHRVAWATGDTAVPATYPKFYRSFMALVPVSAN